MKAPKQNWFSRLFGGKERPKPPVVGDAAATPTNPTAREPQQRPVMHNCPYYLAGKCLPPVPSFAGRDCNYTARDYQNCAVHKAVAAILSGGGMEDALRAAGCIPPGAEVVGAAPPGHPAAARANRPTGPVSGPAQSKYSGSLQHLIDALGGGAENGAGRSKGSGEPPATDALVRQLIKAYKTCTFGTAITTKAAQDAARELIKRDGPQAVDAAIEWLNTGKASGDDRKFLIGLLTEIGDERAVEPLLQHFGSGEKPREVERFFARMNAQKPATEQQPGATAPASPEAAPVATVVRQEPQARTEPAPTQARPAEGNQSKATSRDPGQTIPATSPSGAAATVPAAPPTQVSGKVKRAVLRPKGQTVQSPEAKAPMPGSNHDASGIETSPAQKADKLHMMSEALRAFMGGGGNADQAFESLFADLKDKDPEIRAEASRLLNESTDAQLRLVTIYQECLKSDPRRASLAGRVLGRYLAEGRQGMIDPDIAKMTFGLKVSFLPCGCDHCGKLNKGIPAPPNGGMVPYYSQKDNKGAYAVPVLCDKCGMEFFVVWDQNPR